MTTDLVIRALVNDPTGTMSAWADIRVFDAADELIHTASVILECYESTADGARFAWEDTVYEGSGGGSGMGVWSRPDAHTIQYRLFCQDQSSALEIQEQVFTDGVLHEFEIPADQMLVADEDEVFERWGHFKENAAIAVGQRS